MTISEVLAGVPVLGGLPESVAGARLEGLEYDSRKVAPGYLFFAFPGSRVDGRVFAAQAVNKGAATGLISFTVGDIETAPNALVVTAASSAQDNS